MVDVVKLEKLSQAKDKKKTLIEEVGDLSQVEVMGTRVLVAIYIAGDKFAGTSIIRPASQIKEDVWQGVVGLVLKLGRLAFKDDAPSNTYFYGDKVKVGDWVLFRPGDAKRVQINNVDCRFVYDEHIDMIVANPEIITHR